MKNIKKNIIINKTIEIYFMFQKDFFQIRKKKKGQNINIVIILLSKECRNFFFVLKRKEDMLQLCWQCWKSRSIRHNVTNYWIIFKSCLIHFSFEDISTKNLSKKSSSKTDLWNRGLVVVFSRSNMVMTYIKC